MSRFILRFQGSAISPPEDQVDLIRRHCRVIDESGRMFLIETDDEAAVDRLLRDLPGWKGSKEVFYRTPEPPGPVPRTTKSGRDAD